MILAASLAAPDPAVAQAPARSGQPYAEAAKCSEPGVLLCEDFNYTENFHCGSFSYNPGQFVWRNPGLTSTPNNGIYCGGGTFEAAGNQPSGSPPGGFVRRINVASGEGTLNGCIRGDCDRNTSDSGNYANGQAPSRDLYYRFQIFFSSDYNWPTDLDNKILFLYPDRFTSRPDANVDAGMYFSTGTYCANVNLNFSDALAFRVGSNSGSYKQYPADNNSGGYPEHQEYCSGRGFGNSSGNVVTSTPPNDTPTPGRLFRFSKGRWYTVEFRYKLSDPGVRNGTIEAWIDGTKIYSDSDLETCGGYGASQGSCTSVSEIQLMSWFNPFYTDRPNGYVLLDNFIISKNYIGPPGSSGSSGSGGSPAPDSAPASPTNLRISTGP